MNILYFKIKSLPLFHCDRTHTGLFLPSASEDDNQTFSVKNKVSYRHHLLGSSQHSLLFRPTLLDISGPQSSHNRKKETIRLSTIYCLTVVVRW